MRSTAAGERRSPGARAPSLTILVLVAVIIAGCGKGAPAESASDATRESMEIVGGSLIDETQQTRSTRTFRYTVPANADLTTVLQLPRSFTPSYVAPVDKPLDDYGDGTALVVAMNGLSPNGNGQQCRVGLRTVTDSAKYGPVAGLDPVTQKLVIVDLTC